MTSGASMTTSRGMNKHHANCNDLHQEWPFSKIFFPLTAIILAGTDLWHPDKLLYQAHPSIIYALSEGDGVNGLTSLP